MQQVTGEKGMSIPDKNTFDEITDAATVQLITTSEQWATVVEYAEVNRGGIGIITLNYGY